MDKKQKKQEFVNLIEENQGIIFKVSKMYCDNEECRKDLFQDILLQLWRSFPTYSNQSKFTTWMYRVSLNTAITQFRKTKRNKVETMEDLPINLSVDESQDSLNEKSQLVTKAISKLNLAEKSIIILYMDDYSYEEIAEISGISVSNVGVKINRTKIKLQKILKGLGYGL